ncbi:MAG: hypothetical protein ACYCXY_13450 [Acidimicrobiales bacterium]
MIGVLRILLAALVVISLATIASYVVVGIADGVHAASGTFSSAKSAIAHRGTVTESTEILTGNPFGSAVHGSFLVSERGRDRDSPDHQIR